MAVGIWIGIGVVLLVATVSTLGHITVFEFQRAVRYRKGKLDGVLEPGSHWYWRPGITTETVDLRPRFVSVPGQEVISADGVSVRVSLAAEYRVVDPQLVVNEVDGFEQALYLLFQLAIRDIVASSPIDELLETRAQIGPRLLELCGERAKALGVELARIEPKDIMFPGELKQVFAQVVAARKEGQASVERARGETAAMRGLANAARAVEGNPALLQLRLIQELGKSEGHTIMLGIPESVTPLPAKPAPAPSDD